MRKVGFVKIDLFVVMAFSRKGISRNQQGESLLKMPSKPPSALSSVRETSLFKQTQDQIMHDCQNASSCTLGHARSVFMESDVPAVMQARFDEPMLTSHCKQFSRRRYAHDQGCSWTRF